MVQKAMKDLTYSSLCFPEDIKAKGMDSKEDIPYYYYRDDGIRVWEAIKRKEALVLERANKVCPRDPAPFCLCSTSQPCEHSLGCLITRRQFVIGGDQSYCLVPGAPF